MRTRSQNVNTTNRQLVAVKRDAPNNPVSLYFDVVSAKSYDRMEDRITPKFHSKQRDGKIMPVNPLKVRKLDAVFVPGSYYYTYPNGSYFNGPEVPYFGPDISTLESSPSLDQDKTYTIAHLAKKAIARAKSPDFDFLTFVAELNKTASLFYDAGQRFDRATWRIAKAARKRSRRSADTAAEVFSQMWLEGRYGWRLAYLDAISIAEAVRKTGYLRSRGWAEHSDSDSKTHDSSWSWSSSTGTNSYTHECRWKYRAGSLFSIRTSAPNVGVDVPLTVWELIPYSFVVDWFIDVGQTLQSLAYRPNFKQEHLWITEEVEHYFSGFTASATPNTADTASASSNEVRGRYLLFDRYPFDKPSTIPRFEWNFSLAKAIDLVALLLTSKSAMARFLFK